MVRRLKETSKRGQRATAAQYAEEIVGEYPTLAVTSEGSSVFVRGVLPIIYDGETLERFEIEVQLARSFPRNVPTVRETGGKVPRTTDRHVNPNGDACVLVPEEWMILPESERTLLEFLRGPVRNFFLGQALVDSGEEWPFGQRSHGRAGMLEAYGEMLGVGDEPAIVRYLQCLRHEKIKGHWLCPCGSGRSIRACHVAVVRELQERIPSYVARSALDRLRGIRER